MLNNIGRQVGKAGVGAAMLLASVVPSQDGIAKTPTRGGIDNRAALALCLKHVADTRSEIDDGIGETYNLSSCATNQTPTVACLNPPVSYVSRHAQDRILECIDSNDNPQRAAQCVVSESLASDWMQSMRRPSKDNPSNDLTGIADGKDIYPGVKPGLGSAIGLLDNLGDDRVAYELTQCLGVASENNRVTAKFSGFLDRLKIITGTKTSKARIALEEIIRKALNPEVRPSGYVGLEQVGVDDQPEEKQPARPDSDFTLKNGKKRDWHGFYF